MRKFLPLALAAISAVPGLGQSIEDIAAKKATQLLATGTRVEIPGASFSGLPKEKYCESRPGVKICYIPKGIMPATLETTLSGIVDRKEANITFQDRGEYGLEKGTEYNRDLAEIRLGDESIFISGPGEKFSFWSSGKNESNWWQEGIGGLNAIGYKIVQKKVNDTYGRILGGETPNLKEIEKYVRGALE